MGSLRRRIRWLRLSSALVILSITAGALFFLAGLAHATFGVPLAIARAANVVLAAFSVAAILATIAAVLRVPSPASLAALTETRHPRLGERLVSVVELHAAGSEQDAALLAHLDDETTRLAKDLDFREARPWQTTRRLGIVAGCVVLAALVPALFFSDYRRGQRRLLWAWSPSVHGYEVSVQPGDHFVGRGRDSVVSVHLTPLEDGVRVPTACILVVEGPDTAPVRQRTEAAGDDEFTHVLGALERSVRYRVEAGDLTSATFNVTVVEPIALAADSPTVEATPPPYVQRDAIPVIQRTGLAPFTALQYSRVRFDFRFDRPARKATVRGSHAGQQRVIELPLSQGGQQARWEFVAAEPGPHSGQLVLEAEHGVTWTHPLPAWSVWVDGPPTAREIGSLSNLSAAAAARRIGPEDALPIKAMLEDQVGLGEVVLEYAVGDGPVQRQALADGDGKLRLELDHSFRLRGSAKVGETLKCRLTVSDNRRLAKASITAAPPVPEHDLTPQVTYVPASDNGVARWWTFQVEETADPLHKQEILAERDRLGTRIEQIKKSVGMERQQIEKVARASHQMPVLTAAQSAAIEAARKLNSAIRQDLGALAQEAILRGGEALARLAADIAGKEMAQADKALEQSGAKGLPTDQREERLRQADEALAAALKRLDAADKLNALLAQERLDVKDLERLAEREAELAERAAKLTSDPNASPQQLDALRAEQDKLAEAFRALLARNPRLQPVLQAQRRARAEQLARQAQQLAMAQRKAAQSAQDAELAELKKQVVDLVKLQRELAKRVAALDKALKSEPATATLGAPDQSARDAAAALEAAQVEAALARQADTEQQLARLAEQLDRTVALERDPRAAATRLARLQDDLIKQLEKLGEDFARIPIEQTRSRLQELTRAQRTLHEALAKVERPKTAESLFANAAALLQQAADLLERKDALAAHEHMEQARNALEQLAAASPIVPPATPADTPVDQQIKKQAAEARTAAKDQRALADAVRKLLAELADRRRREPSQQKLEKELARLAEQMKDFASQAGKADKQAAGSAASAADKAQQAMDKSRHDEAKGMLSQAKADAAKAMDQLDAAGKMLEDAARALAKPGTEAKDMPDSSALRQAAEDADMQLRQAQKQLQSDGPAQQGAPMAMQKAAQALQKTAKQAAQAMTPSQPAPGMPPPGGDPAKAFAGAAPAGGALSDADIKALSGKAWGELPGELRTRLVQDLRARYGDDYGAIIQRYFQQIAAPRR